MSSYCLIDEKSITNITIEGSAFYKGEHYDFYVSNSLEMKDYIFCLYHDDALGNHDFLDTISFLLSYHPAREDEEMPLPRGIIKEGNVFKGVVLLRPVALEKEIKSFSQRMKTYKNRRELTSGVYDGLSKAKTIMDRYCKLGRCEESFFCRFDPDLLFFNENGETCYLGFNDLCFRKMRIGGTRHSLYAPGQDIYELNIFPRFGKNDVRLSSEQQYKDLVDAGIAALMVGNPYKDKDGNFALADSSNQYRGTIASFIWTYFSDDLKKSIMTIYNSNKVDMFTDFFVAFEDYSNMLQNGRIVDDEAYKIQPTRPSRNSSGRIINKANPIMSFLWWIVSSLISISLLGLHADMYYQVELPLVSLVYVFAVVFLYLLSAIFSPIAYKLLFVAVVLAGGYGLNKYAGSIYLSDLEYFVSILRLEKGVAIIFISVVSALMITHSKRTYIDLKNDYMARRRKE